MVNAEMDKIVPIYSWAILNTEKNVIKVACGSEEGFKPEARKFITELQSVRKGKDSYEIL